MSPVYNIFYHFPTTNETSIYSLKNHIHKLLISSPFFALI